ncbi:Protein-tyrosine phosphatase [Ostertagia ostertagi]
MSEKTVKQMLKMMSEIHLTQTFVNKYPMDVVKSLKGKFLASNHFKAANFFVSLYEQNARPRPVTIAPLDGERTQDSAQETCEIQKKNEAATQDTPTNTQPKADTESEMKPADASFSSLNSQISDDVNSAQSAVEIDQKTSVVIQRLREFAWLCDQSTAEQLLNDFNTLPQPDMNACKACCEPQNLKKNRYSNIPCIDTSRVLLNFRRPEVGYGYIHANRIEYPTLRSKYIITQGPLPNTVNAFWQMIWQENVRSIVMLCQPIEQGKRKSAEYFSPICDMTLSYDQLNVVLKERKWEDSLIISTLEIEYLQESRQITHYHWRDWKDWTVGFATIANMSERVINICDMTLSYDQLNVVLKERKWEDSLIISTLEIEYLQESRQITHYHWRDWKDWTVGFATIANMSERVIK